jgi:tetratricopeptide (TPR) repeat protein
MVDANLADDMSSDSSDSDDTEADFIKEWWKSGELKFNQNQYAEAEKLLARAFSLSEKKHRTFKGRDRLLNLLASTYAKQGKLPEVEKLVQTYPQLKDGDCLELLGITCCRKGLLHSAKNVLEDHTIFKGRERVFKELVFAYFREKEWLNAENFLLDILKGGLVDELETLHTLAEVYLVRGELVSAKQYCERALRGRRKTLGKHHDLYYDSLCLSVAILIANAEVEEAEFYSGLLPSGFQGSQLSKLAYL